MASSGLFVTRPCGAGPSLTTRPSAVGSPSRPAGGWTVTSGSSLDVSVGFGVISGARERRRAFADQELQKLNRGRVELLVPPVDDRQRTCQTMMRVLAVDPDRDECPCLHFTRQCGRGENGDPFRDLDSTFNIFDVIKL